MSLLEDLGGPNYDSLRKKVMNEEPLNVFVMGSTGVGKSSLLSFLDRPDKPTQFFSCDSIEAVTKDVTSRVYLHESCLWLQRDEIRQFNVRLIDGPGLNDAGDRGLDLQHVYNIVNEIKTFRKIHSLIFVAKMGRFDTQFLSTLKYCCNELFSHVPDNFIKIVLTHLEEHTFEDFKESEEVYYRRMDEIRSKLVQHIGNKITKVYFIHTARKRNIKENARVYYEYCRNSLEIIPKDGNHYEFDVPSLDCHSLYIRDKLIYDIYEDTARFNWKRSSVMLPPSVHTHRAEALVKLYQRKVTLTENIPDGNKFVEKMNGLLRQISDIEDDVENLRNDHLELARHSSKQTTISTGTQIEVKTEFQPVHWHDNSDCIDLTGIQSHCSKKNVIFEVTFRVRAKLWGNLILHFYVPGEFRHVTLIETKKKEIKKLKTEIQQCKNRVQATGTLTAELAEIDKKIKRLQRSHIKLEDLELIYSII